MTSRRCFSRWRSSFHSRRLENTFVPPSPAALKMEANARPKENCVETITEMKMRASRMIIDPVLPRFDVICSASQRPMEPPPVFDAMPATLVPVRIMLSDVPTHMNSSVEPKSFVPTASTARHQK